MVRISHKISHINNYCTTISIHNQGVSIRSGVFGEAAIVVVELFHTNATIIQCIVRVHQQLATNLCTYLPFSHTKINKRPNQFEQMNTFKNTMSVILPGPDAEKCRVGQCTKMPAKRRQQIAEKYQLHNTRRPTDQIYRRK